MIDSLLRIPVEAWTMAVLAAPFILFGLAAAGLIHVLLPESLVLRWMGSPGLLGVMRAALIGVPLPVCSCGVVPITVELRRKGASRPAAQSFLITTPESSIDSIFLTWGLMGPVMAIARPVAAFFTAVLGGILSIASARTVEELTTDTEGERFRVDPHAHHHHGHDHDHDHGHDHDHHHDHDHSLAFAENERARLAFRKALGLGDKSPGRDLSVWKDLVRPALRYGFGELLDGLAFWLVVGIGLAGVLTALLPDNLDELGLGTGLLPMIALLVVGIPLYMCASASTPIAAALMLKGVSPGAALVFLLAGPATNAATVLLLAATFGRRFVKIYVVSVAVGALASGLLLDLLLGDTDLTAGLRSVEDAGTGPFMILMTLVLVVLLARSLVRGAWADGVDELRSAGLRVQDRFPLASRLRLRHVVVAVLLVVTAAYAATGLHSVPVGARGYGFVFGELVATDLEPGLHFLPPAPLGRMDVRRVEYPRKTDVGFRTDLDLVQRRQGLVNLAPRNEWHSPVAAMNADSTRTSYLTGDGNLVELSFSVHYALHDPESFFYGVDHSRDFVELYAEASAREHLAGLGLEELLTERRLEVEAAVGEALQVALDERGLGVAVLAVRIVDLHPPQAVVPAFREVSSAKEDRETAIHVAREAQARRVPRGRGQAAKHVAEAEAEASRRREEAAGESRSFVARAEPFGQYRSILGHLLWIETLERVLLRREKLILPPGHRPDDSRGITFWQRGEPPLSIFQEDGP